MDERTRDTPPVEEAPDFEAAPPPEEPELPRELVLSKPIKAHGDSNVTVVTWREPTGGDIADAGNPITFTIDEGRLVVALNERKMTAMMSVLMALPPSSIRMLAAKDWNTIAWRLFRFFTPL
jgi:hypothetical protein